MSAQSARERSDRASIAARKAGVLLPAIQVSRDAEGLNREHERDAYTANVELEHANLRMRFEIGGKRSTIWQQRDRGGCLPHQLRTPFSTNPLGCL